MTAFKEADGGCRSKTDYLTGGSMKTDQRDKIIRWHGITLVSAGKGFRVGLVASGQASVGLVSSGWFSLGLVSSGLFSIGLISSGLVAIGLIKSNGFVSIGRKATGMFAIGRNVKGRFVKVIGETNTPLP